MSEDNKTIENGGEEAINAEEAELSSAEEAVSDIITERKIKPAPVHTVKNKESDVIYIPEPRDESSSPKRRFIKSDNSEFVSVRAEQVKSDTETEVTKFTDRFVAQEVPENVHTGHTGKIETYDKIHVPEESGKMIGASLFDEQMKIAGTGITPDKEPEEEIIPEVSSEDEALQKEEELLNAPTKHIDPQPGSILREIAGSADDDVRRNPDQLMMEGFESVGKKTAEEIASEEELKDKLSKSREEKIKNFRFWDKEKTDSPASDTDEIFTDKKKTISLPAFAAKFSSKFSHLATPFTPVKCEEYTDLSDRKTILDAVKNERNRTFARILILAVLGAVVLVIDLIAKLTASGNNGFFTVFGGSVNALVAVNLIVLAVSCVVLFPELKNGVISVLKLRPKTDALLLLTMCSAVVQTFASFFTQLKIADSYQLLAPAAVIVAIPYLLSKMFYYDNMRQCFKTVSAKSEKSYLRKVTDPELKARLGIADGETEKNAVYSGKTRFITDFPASGENSAASGMPGSRITAAFAAVSLIVALIALIINKSFLCGMTALTLCSALCLPVCSLAATGFYLSRANKGLALKSSFIQSFDDAKTFSSIDNVACDAAEIFSAEITNCLTAKDVSVNQARFAAAATCAGTGSLMEKMFKEDIEKYTDVLPESIDAVYEDKLGLSSYVSNCTVLLGNHDMLVNHNVELPDEEIIVKFLKEDEKPLYLAMEGRFTALFAVRYSVSDETRDGIKSLVNSGASLLLGTNDSNITDVYAELLLDIPHDSVRIISPAAAKKLEEARSAVADNESASVVFTSSFESLCRCASQALKLSSINAVSKAVCIGGAAVSLILGCVLVFTGAFKSTSAMSVIVIQGVWLALCFLSPFFGANKKISSGVSAITDRLKNIGSKKKEETDYEGEDEPAEIESVEPSSPAESLFGSPEEENNEAEDPKEEKEAPSSAPGRKTEESAKEPQSPYDENKNTAAEPEESVIDKATDDVISGIFEKRSDSPKREETGKKENSDEGDISSDVIHSLDMFSPKDAAEEKSEENGAQSAIIASEKLKSEFSSIGGFFKELTENSIGAPVKDESDSGFSLFGKDRASRKNADDVERDYESRKEDEESLRRKFTVPNDPSVPVFDVRRDKKPAEPKFEAPLDTSDVNVFNDELFRRFEDDKIFAGLHEGDDEDTSF